VGKGERIGAFRAGPGKRTGNLAACGDLQQVHVGLGRVREGEPSAVGAELCVIAKLEGDHAAQLDLLDRLAAPQRQRDSRVVRAADELDDFR
jgi:hypothetical protein